MRYRKMNIDLPVGTGGIKSSLRQMFLHSRTVIRRVTMKFQ